MRENLAIGSVLAVMLLSSPSVTFAQDSFETDGDLADSIRSDLARLGIEGLEVRVIGGMATLEGTVESLAKKEDAEALARRKPGVGEVFNELEVVRVQDDAELKRLILDELAKSRNYTIYDEVEVSVAEGVVTLEGRVPQDSAEAGIVKDVSKIRGVRAIQNQIRVLPHSSKDEKLQEAVAIDVYAALQALDPLASAVHVVVENGRVTLSGAVDDEKSRSAAEEAARRTEGVRSVENRLRVGR